MGKLLAIGGGEQRDGDAPILTDFVRQAGGKKAVITAIAAGAEKKLGNGMSYNRTFRRLGAREVTSIHIIRGSGERAPTVGGIEEMGDNLRLHDICLHILPHSSRFNRQQRLPLIEPSGNGHKNGRSRRQKPGAATLRQSQRRTHV